MSTLARRAARPLLQLAAVSAPFLAPILAPPAASAQAGPFQRYSERWYGQNFYDGQRTGLFDFHHRRHVQHNAGFYGPAMMYSRQYGDEYGYRTAAPFRPPLSNGGVNYGGSDYTY